MTRHVGKSSAEGLDGVVVFLDEGLGSLCEEISNILVNFVEVLDDIS